ncbi:MAG: extracellular solute-binding protein [Lactobacillales bacterium]|jgi:arabinogalactan oligomer/maltooligosaccharide transport system substrate-binding protein|nr:extracellular solute-binding protein [Lactobacillales bacterium]
MKKSNWKKFIFTGAMLSIAALTLAGCGSSKDKEGTSTSETKDSAAELKLWVTNQPGTKKFYEGALADFKKEHPKYKITIVETEDAKAQENVKKDPDAAADVFTLPHDQLGQMVDAGVIYENEKFGDDIKKDQTDAAVEAATYKGKMYAYPYGIESQVLFYNKEKLSEDDIKTYEDITSKATMGLNMEAVNAYALAPLFMSNGDYLYGKTGEDPKGTDFNNAKGVEVLKWMATQKSNKGAIQVSDDTMAAFGSGKIASFESGPWDKAAAIEAIGKDNLGIAAYPTVNLGSGEVQQKSFLGVKLYAVNAATKVPLAAMELANYLSGEKMQEIQFKDSTRNIIPTNKTVQDSDMVKNDALAKAVVTMSGSDYSVVMPKIPEMVSFWTPTSAVMSDAYTGKIQEDQYQAKLDQLVKDISAKE